MDKKADEVPPSYDDIATGYTSTAGTWNSGYTGSVEGPATSMPSPQGPSYAPSQQMPPPQGPSHAPSQQAYQYPVVSQGAMYNTTSGMMTGIVTQQPMVYSATGVVNVPDNMTLALFVTFFCCLPIGIFAILKASEARDALLRNDYVNARRLSDESRRLSYYGIAGGVATLVVMVIILVVVFTVVIDSYNYY